MESWWVSRSADMRRRASSRSRAQGRMGPDGSFAWAVESGLLAIKMRLEKSGHA